MGGEQAIPRTGRLLHVKEAGGKRRRRLRAQELPPRCAGAPFRGWRDLQRFEDAADRGRCDLAAELAQLTLNADVPPGAVLGGEPLDEHGDLGADRRASRGARAGPFRGDQAMPLLELLK